MLVNMLSDRDLGNHRLALTTLNSAIHNKMDIILPHLSELLPAVIGDTHIKPELIREVQMGPFKHKVDDGLELRKVSIYEPFRQHLQFTDGTHRALTRRCMHVWILPFLGSTSPSSSTGYWQGLRMNKTFVPSAI